MRVACCQVALDIEASALGWDGALTAVRAAAAAIRVLTSASE